MGLEALSRGAQEAHFVELDPWVIRTVLQPNVAACSMERSTVLHGGRAESFLQRAGTAAHLAPKPFDFIR